MFSLQNFSLIFLDYWTDCFLVFYFSFFLSFQGLHKIRQTLSLPLSQTHIGQILSPTLSLSHVREASQRLSEHTVAIKKFLDCFILNFSAK